MRSVFWIHVPNIGPIPSGAVGAVLYTVPKVIWVSGPVTAWAHPYVYVRILLYSISCPETLYIHHCIPVQYLLQRVTLTGLVFMWRYRLSLGQCTYSTYVMYSCSLFYVHFYIFIYFLSSSSCTVLCLQSPGSELFAIFSSIHLYIQS